MFANCLGDSADLCPSSSHRIHRQKGFERREFLASHPPRVFGNGDQIRRFGDTTIGDLIRLRLSYRNVMESTLAEFTTENRIEVGAIDNYITSVTPTDGHPRKEFDEGSHRPLPSDSVRPPRAQSHHSTLRGSVANNDVESHPIMELTTAASCTRPFWSSGTTSRLTVPSFPTTAIGTGTGRQSQLLLWNRL